MSMRLLGKVSVVAVPILLMAAAPSASAQCGYSVVGAINTKYQALGGVNGILGCPTTNELPTPDGVGRFNHFVGGSIYWTAPTGAWSIRGAIRTKWSQLGWETSYLGYPTSDEMVAPDGVGRYQFFQAGSVYWTPTTGARAITGDILSEWGSHGWETGRLGYPTSDELATPDGVGRYNTFEDGSIYWSPTSGAHAIWEPILSEWGSRGWEAGSLGYPTSSPYACNGGVRCEFQKGSLFLDTPTGREIEITAANNILFKLAQTVKIQQLTGDFDRQLGVNTRSLTDTRAGVWGTDLGSSFVHNGRLWFLFGDTWGARTGDRDCMAWADITTPSTLTLNFKLAGDGKFLPITPGSLPTGGFSVPSAGISVNGAMYMAYTTATGFGAMGTSSMLRSTNDGTTWSYLYQLSHDNPGTPQFDGKFINSSFAQEGDTVWMWGAGQYRASDIYVAKQPAGSMGGNAWQYFTGMDANGNPTWSSSQAAAQALVDDPEFGEFSCAFLPQIGKWVMLYNAGNPRGINMRVADKPYGPWSPPRVIFDPAHNVDAGYRHFMHDAQCGCDSLSDPNRGGEWGGEYGPYIIPSFTTGDRFSLNIHYTMSTWNPYNVMLMRSTVRVDDQPLLGQPVTNKGGWYRVKAKNSANYLDIDGSVAASGSNLRQAAWGGGSDQIFQFEHQGDGYYKIWARGAGANIPLNVDSCGTANGANVNQATATGSNCQLFRLEDVGQAFVRIVAKNSARVFDVAGCSAASGANIALYDWWGGDCQKFALEWVSLPVMNLASTYKVANVHSGKAMDIVGTSNGGNLQQYSWLGGSNQIMHFDHLGRGVYKIWAHGSGVNRVFDVQGLGTANGTNVYQWDWVNGANQKFLVEDIGFGQVRIMDTNSGKALEVAGLSTANGGNVAIWDWWAGSNQRWTMETVAAPNPVTVIVDNTDAGFAASANWTAATATAGYYGSNYRTRATQAVSDQAAWTVNLPESGNYQVFARWTAGSNRAASAPFTVVHSGGTQTVNVNQQANGGQFVSLGTFNFTAGSAQRVRLSCWTTAGFNVVADAVQFVKQ